MKKIKVFLTKGSGEGISQEAAYCQALNKAGLINLNLIQLTSVLPHHCQVINQRPKFSYQDYGKRVYVIMTEIRTSQIGETICAGLGWIKSKKKTSYSLVVQIKGQDEKKVKKEISDSLKEIIKAQKEKYQSEELNIVTEKITCKNKPVCALVSLVFDKIEDWF